MDFIYIDDIVNALVLSMLCNVKNEILNVGSGKSTSIKEIVEKILGLMNKDIEIVYDISRPKQIVSRRQADISKIRKILGFNPNVSVDEGLKRIIESMER